MSDPMSGDGDLTVAQMDDLRGALSTSDDSFAIDASAHGGTKEPIVLRYDLAGVSTSDGDQLPGLELIHERFAREIVAEFRRLLGTTGVFTPQRLILTKFAQAYATMQIPTALIVVEFEGLECSCIIDMTPEIMMHFLDLMMGGPGGAVVISTDLAIRGFTSTERGLIQRLVAIFGRAMSVAWEEITKVSFKLVRVATDPRHVALYAPGEQMVLLPTQIDWGDVSGVLNLLIPLTYLRPFDDHLSRTATPEHVQAEGQYAGALTESLMDVPLEISAVLGAADWTLHAILGLEAGDVIRLDTDPAQPATVYVEGIPSHYGFPTVHHGNLAIQLVDSHRATRPRTHPKR